MFDPPAEDEAPAAHADAEHDAQMRALREVLVTRPFGRQLWSDLQRLSGVIGDITPDMLWRAVDETDRLAADHRERSARMAALRATGPVEPDAVVYYMQMETLVKIGTSTNLARRLDAIRPQRVLAVEPGDHSVEYARHQEFYGFRSHGEWFHLSEPLTRHVERIQVEHPGLCALWAGWKP